MLVACDDTLISRIIFLIYRNMYMLRLAISLIKNTEDGAGDIL